MSNTETNGNFLYNYWYHFYIIRYPEIAYNLDAFSKLIALAIKQQILLMDLSAKKAKFDDEEQEVQYRKDYRRLKKEIREVEEMIREQIMRNTMQRMGIDPNSIPKGRKRRKS